jgi:hypothetical protein
MAELPRACDGGTGRKVRELEEKKTKKRMRRRMVIAARLLVTSSAVSLNYQRRNNHISCLSWSVFCSLQYI